VHALTSSQFSFPEAGSEQQHASPEAGSEQRHSFGFCRGSAPEPDYPVPVSQVDGHNQLSRRLYALPAVQSGEVRRRG
jgi:hypothetical protein